MSCHRCVSLVSVDQITWHVMVVLNKHYSGQMPVDQMTWQIIAVLHKHCSGQKPVDQMKISTEHNIDPMPLQCQLNP
jgi:hypothetical protein